MSVHMRKKMAILLAAAMLVGTAVVPSAFAEDAVSESQTTEGTEVPAESPAGETAEDPEDAAISKEQAEKLLRQYISIPDDYKLQRSSYSGQKLFDGEQKIWRLVFTKTVNGREMGNIYASLDSDTGQLLGFDSYSNEPGAAPTYPLKVDREAAQELAEGFIKEVAADYVPQIAFNETDGADLLPPLSGKIVHQLRFDRIVNGMPYTDNYIHLSVDSEGHVLGFQLQWDDTIEFPKPSKTLTAEQATAAVKKLAKPELAYIVTHGEGGKREPILSYGLSPIVIDAATGEELQAGGYGAWDDGVVQDAPLTEKPLSAPPKAGKLSEEQAAEAVKKAFGLPEGAKLTESNYNEYVTESGETSTSWDLSWSLMKDGKEDGYVFASVNGSTGAVRSYYGYSHSEPAATGSVLPLDQALQKAVDAVKAQLPWLTDELYLVKPNEDRYKNVAPDEIGSYRISFKHKVHGASVDYDYVSLNVNARTGKVESYDASISEYDYPSNAPKTIDAAEAVESYLNYYDVALTYRVFQEFWWEGNPLPIEKYKLMMASGEIEGSEVESKSKVELVYKLQQKPLHESVFLDAQNGEWRSRETGAVTTLEVPKPTDAAGHWAEEPLSLMVAYKALDLEDGKVRPNEKITRGELIKMLVLARNSGGGYYPMYGMDQAGSAEKSTASFADVAADSEYFAYVESALQQNLIDLGDGSFNPEGLVTRDEMAELIVRALGYNTLADYDHIFKSNFKDEAAIDNKGQAAIVVGLKIMSLSDGKFLPDKEVSRAEASIAFYRYLQKRAELQEAPLRM
ncbi:S-layer homology domain-containing protein [Paenibacillus soyae]|uniref:S-layer homology domain-containing protein n=1 Tax=Paenibacillus soyae TaxID=2969249 RepID=A0A9X2SBN8_9BACL|nr:S-layer homology domain-containing protein [Paenibacillus soyae]